MAQQVLIVDDDPTQRRLMEGVVTKLGFRAVQATGGQEALEILDSVAGREISVVLLDLRMPDVDGLGVLGQLRPQRPTLPVIVLTAQGGIETVVQAMRAGADDFIVKPASPERVQVSIQNALKLTALSGEVNRLRRTSSGEFGFGDLIGESGAMREISALGERAAQSNIPILITGESGVGKEVIARAIQGASDRAGKPFVTVNCGALPENLVESILFGHEKGAFTGAHEKHAGKFQEANGGTLFLDEIGELRPDMQVKLLRALQEGEVDPVGAKRPVKVDIRLISATNKDLEELVKSGEFREDLFYRLNVFPIHIPPLRDRKDDVPLLIDHFIGRFTVEEGKKIVGIDAAAMEMLRQYGWPGNIRQLENTVYRAVVLCDGDALSIRDFPQIAHAMDVELPPIEAPVKETLPLTPPAEGQTETAEKKEPPRLDDVPLREPATPSDLKGHIRALAGDGHLRPLDDIEGEMIRMAIDRYAGHMSEVARRLGIGRSTLYRKVRDLGLDPKSEAS
jgi:DNA-binding NtrC family response regulator